MKARRVLSVPAPDPWSRNLTLVGVWAATIAFAIVFVLGTLIGR